MPGLVRFTFCCFRHSLDLRRCTCPKGVFALVVFVIVTINGAMVAELRPKRCEQTAMSDMQIFIKKTHGEKQYGNSLCNHF